VPEENKKSRTTVLQAAPQLKPDSPRKEFGATSSPDSDKQRVPFSPVLSLFPSTRRVPFEATMPKKEHTIWCYKQPQN
jgi:hypothetical protein